MLGYRVYFDGTKFVADNEKTQVQSIPCDSTISWMSNEISVENAVAKLNKEELNNVKKCKQCGEYFFQTDGLLRET